MLLVRVDPAHAGERVDHFVAAARPGLSVNAARRMLADGRVRVDGRRSRKGERLAPGQVVEIEDGPAEKGSPILPDPTLQVAVLYLDDALVAIDKPPGIPSHPLHAGEVGTAASAIVARFPECAGASPDPREGGLVHRLDTKTGGVLVAARSAEIWPLLRAALAGRDSRKEYLAEVAGDPPASGALAAPIGRVGRRHGRVRVGGGRMPLDARTEWEVLEARDGSALLRARLQAGRAHQVRAHLAAAGFPILGDDVYGDERAHDLATRMGVSGLRLHAASIVFEHPITKAALLIEAPAPGWAKLRA